MGLELTTDKYPPIRRTTHCAIPHLSVKSVVVILLRVLWRGQATLKKNGYGVITQ